MIQVDLLSLAPLQFLRWTGCVGTGMYHRNSVHLSASHVAMFKHTFKRTYLLTANCSHMFYSVE